MSPPRPDPLWGVILAAGASARMGRPKALLPLARGGDQPVPLVRAHLHGLARRCGRVRVVVGAEGEAVAEAAGTEAEIVWNLHWEQSSKGGPSLALALVDLPDDAWVLVTPVDAPPASERLLDALLAVGPPAVPARDGQDGHPVLVRAGAARAALTEGTLRDALRAATRVHTVERPRDLNTPEDWEDWMAHRSATERER